jgi:hypothetical protein
MNYPKNPIVDHMSYERKDPYKDNLDELFKTQDSDENENEDTVLFDK